MKYHDEMYDGPQADGELRFLQFGEAVEEMIDQHFGETDALPATVEVSRYTRVKTKWEDIADSMLEHIREKLFDLHDSGCDGFYDGFIPSKRVERAAAAFVRIMDEEYIPWAMDEKETEVVNVNQWIKDEWEPNRKWQMIAVLEATGDSNDPGISVPLGSNGMDGCC